MTLVLVYMVAIIVLLIALIAWQYLVHSHDSRIAEARRLDAVSVHDQSFLKVISNIQGENSRRESVFRGEIQALTEALGRSKESVPVVYPRDPNQPLEPSPGWFDVKPNIKTIR